jgi:short-subunit dehydrogenase
VKPIDQQVVVITGASSGIGRQTALQFADKGASVVIAARNEAALGTLAEEVEQRGGKSLIVVTDVAEWGQVYQLAEEAIKKFGRIDTWVNNAAVNEHATVEQMTIEEIERIIQVKLFGQIYGMKAALPYMKSQGQGTIINVASILAKRAAPLHAPYVAANHGIAGFTETLRMELEHERSPINVTLVMPAYINTPFFDNARSKLGVKPKPVPPVYAPSVVADAILFAAEHRRRDIVVGGSGKLITVMQRISPSLLDRLMLLRGVMFKQQMTDQPDNKRDNLFEASDGAGSTTAEWDATTIGWTQGAIPRSLYTRYLEQYPNRKRLLIGAAAAGAFMLIRGARK